jgi:SAM-dependent methyltransferase
MDIREHNRRAWDRQVESGSPWTIPVGPQEIAAARRGEWTIILTPNKPVPRTWLPDLPGKRVLCLASGGGQQGPVLAAAGARVTVFDNSPRQLGQDRRVAEREGLAMETVEGDMRDLSAFAGESFDYIVHPVSNVFVPDVRPVWREAFRVLCHGGVMVAGFDNPVVYLFDYEEARRTGKLEVRFRLPYSDVEQLSAEEQQRYRDEGQPFEFSHMLEDQIGGQLEAGFIITGFYEDYDEPSDPNLLSRYMPPYMATRATKP